MHSYLSCAGIFSSCDHRLQSCAHGGWPWSATARGKIVSTSVRHSGSVFSRGNPAYPRRPAPNPRINHRISAPSYNTVVIVPARNEEAGILLSLKSLHRQTRRPDLIVVVVNNSTDNTEQYAAGYAGDPRTPPTVVLTLNDNPHKKAGALNYAMEWLRVRVGGRLDAVRHVLAMDADTELHPNFLERAINVMASDQKIGGVSAACFGRTGLWGSLWQRYLLGMQILEYGRAAHARYRTNVHTMSGAGSFYRGTALQSVIDRRGQVFWEDHRNLVEDYETTLALKEAGWKVTANEFCIAYTDLMPTLRELVVQRERWTRGTVDALRLRGWSAFTRRAIVTLFFNFFGFACFLIWGSAYWTSLAGGNFQHWPAILLLTAFWAVYSAVAVRQLGWKAMLVQALLIPGMLYTLLNMYWSISSVLKSYFTPVPAWK